MVKLKAMLKQVQYLAFIDFEATQYTHEIIAMGIIIYEIRNNYDLVKTGKEYRFYVKAKGQVGKIVTELTKITEDIIDAKGITIQELDHQIATIFAPIYFQTRFVAFSQSDAAIIKDTIKSNKDFELPNLMGILKRIFDFQAVLKRYIRNKNGPYSLKKYLEIFNIVESDPLHDPLTDAKALGELFIQFLKNKTIVKNEYIKLLQKHSNPVVSKIITTLYQNGSISKKEFEAIVLKDLDD
ncbi:MAG: hypothetical protein LBR37_03235 [Erysipelotrichaceae bacterium]|jgi:hypothetical protein|nr:hypothetical protein [Erysipelotrichaceae bacterium]